MIGIIAAMQIEIDGLRAQLTEPEERVISGITFTKGKLDGKDTVLAVCGIGKVFAGMCAQTMILAYGVDAIVNTGVAGTLTSELGIGDIALATAVVQHDMDTSPLGDPVGMISGINVVTMPCDDRLRTLAEAIAAEQGHHTWSGITASGDQFISTMQKRTWIRDTFDAIACEMEGAAIGQVCYVNQVPFLVIRAISDTASGESVDDYPRFAAEAAANSIRLVSELIRRY